MGITRYTARTLHGSATILGPSQNSHSIYQVVHYTPQQSFGMHHDSSAFQPRLLTAFYYLSDVEEGGETLFPAADGAMAADEALRSAARAERCISSRQRRSPPPLAPLGPALLAPGGAPHPGGFWGLRGL